MEHPIFSDLQEILNTIQFPDCCSTVDANAPVFFCSCVNCKKTDLLDKLKGDVIHIHASLKNLSSFAQNLEYRLGALKTQVNDPGFLADRRFKEMMSTVAQVKLKLPYTAFDEFCESDDPPVSSQENPSPEDENPELITKYNTKYNNLDETVKKCLWCFSVFPANTEIKKRVLINWWIGEGYIQQPTDVSPGARKSSGREEGEDMLRILEDGGFIEQVVKKKRRTNRWRMLATARWLVARNSSAENQGLKNKNLILRENLNFDLDRSHVGDVKTVFNVDKIVITEMEAALVADMKDLVVLHLGKSHVRGLNLITTSLKKKKKRLSFLSLEGTLMLKELPSWVCQLKTLKVLSISQCQALERLPRKIGRLTSLSHLDFSGCHILFEMPKALKSLSALEVLKGFVIVPNSESHASCSLGDLGLLERLRELSLSVLRIDFPNANDLADLAGIKGLVSLKIQWKSASTSGEEHEDKPPAEVKLPQAQGLFCCFNSNGLQVGAGDATSSSPAHCLPKLEKLDLRFPPKKSAQFLLAPTNFPILKQLYITGSEFDQLVHDDTAVWEKVEVLRLISSPQLSPIDWHDLLDLFPELSYLELLNCPNLHFSVVDQEGVWTKHQS